MNQLQQLEALGLVLPTPTYLIGAIFVRNLVSVDCRRGIVRLGVCEVGLRSSDSTDTLLHKSLPVSVPICTEHDCGGPKKTGRETGFFNCAADFSSCCDRRRSHHRRRRRHSRDRRRHHHQCVVPSGGLH